MRYVNGGIALFRSRILAKQKKIIKQSLPRQSQSGSQSETNKESRSEADILQGALREAARKVGDGRGGGAAGTAGRAGTGETGARERETRGTVPATPTATELEDEGYVGDEDIGLEPWNQGGNQFWATMPGSDT